MTRDASTVSLVLLLYAAVVVSPGPNFALISKLAVSGNRRGAAGAILGLATAATFYAILAMTGLALVLTRIGWLAKLVQVCGGCYLVYLGLAAWRSPKLDDPSRPRGTGHVDLLQGLRMGSLVNLSNPKGIAFFIGFYAAAIPSGTSLAAKLTILLGGFLLEILWYGFVTVLLSSGPARVAYRRFGKWIERAIGTMLAAFGCRLVLRRL